MSPLLNSRFHSSSCKNVSSGLKNLVHRPHYSVVRGLSTCTYIPFCVIPIEKIRRKKTHVFSLSVIKLENDKKTF